MGGRSIASNSSGREGSALVADDWRVSKGGNARDIDRGSTG